MMLTMNRTTHSFRFHAQGVRGDPLWWGPLRCWKHCELLGTHIGLLGLECEVQAADDLEGESRASITKGRLEQWHASAQNIRCQLHSVTSGDAEYSQLPVQRLRHATDSEWTTEQSLHGLAGWQVIDWLGSAGWLGWAGCLVGGIAATGRVCNVDWAAWKSCCGGGSERRWRERGEGRVWKGWRGWGG